MAEIYTKEQLNNLSQEDLVQTILSMQEHLEAMQKNYESLDHTMQLMLEQLADAKRHRFGRSSEQLEDNGQLTLDELDSSYAIFNEAEVLYDSPDEEEETVKPRGKKKKGKREEDLKDLPVEVISHQMSEKDLKEFFGDEEYKQLPDEIQRRYVYHPAKVCVEEHHIEVYSGKESERMIKATHPKALLKGSLASSSLMAGIINGKYVNALPFYRLEKTFQNDGVNVTRKAMADWSVKVSERYLSLLYDHIRDYLIQAPILQADETPVLVNKDGRDAGSKSYMWVYRTGRFDTKHPIILYEYQKTRKADHPREFLKDFSGVCVTDGYQVYHTLEGERQDLTIAGCWAHARRRYDEALKALPKDKRKDCLANTALKMIRAIYKANEAFDAFPPEERLQKRQTIVKPLVEAYFAWVKENHSKVLKGTKTEKGMQYSINQEKYLKTFLDYPDVPMDNNAAEQSIKNFCVGKKNWLFCDTLSGAKSSAIIYSIVETAKANNLKVYEYINHILSVLPEHMEDTDYSFIDDLLPWSEKIPKECKKQAKK
ncbi:MAG: IS66 family transposase [Lachnospiraceae bacterium]|nr:IS66 family transposase [Lachnospiraceae bacterium]